MKTYVLDTSVLLAEGKRALHSFPNSEVVIPLVVVTELESKRNDASLGYLARSVLRELDSFIQKGDISTGIKLDNGSNVRVEMNHIDHVEILKSLKNPSSKTNDIKIISVARYLSDSGVDVEVLSKDIPLRLLANMHGVKAADMVRAGVDRDFIDDIKEFEISNEDIEELFANDTVKLDLDVPVNTGVILKAGTSSALAISKPDWNFTKVPNMELSTLKGRSKEQNIAMKMLVDDTIKAVSLGGKAGTGKTAIALAAGYDAVQHHGYKKIVVFRSMHSVGGEELGFLPGTEQEKLDPWTAAIFDALGSFLNPAQINTMKAKRQIEVLPITHVRGRTFNNSYIIVDEAQNLDKSTLMTLMTRVGHSSKIVLTHDVSQRDNLRVSRYDGIYEVVSRMHGNKLFSHIEMVKSERSELAQQVSELLDDM